jgi:pimeloyl-ACP methyl ester carboxylesterase
MRKVFAGCIIFMLAALAVTPVLGQDSAKFEPADCLFDVPSGYQAECGYVLVPESRNPATADNTNEIRLSVAVLKSFSASPEPDPVIYFEGGPGGHSMAFGDFYADAFTPFLETRDVIIFDQRGVGYSEPDMMCTNVLELSYELLDEDLSIDEELAVYDEAYFECRERMLSEGTNLLAYNTDENAADVRDIATALGYARVNVFGISYGSRLALEVMRDYPEIVRSSVIDGVYPPNIDAYPEFIPNSDRVFNMLFDGCAADAACDAAFPDLEVTFYSTVDRLNAQPEMVSYFDDYTGETRDVLVTGDLLVDGLFGLLYATDYIGELPLYIYEASEGVYDGFLDDLMFTLFFNYYFSDGMYWAAECYEEAAFSTEETTIALTQGIPSQMVDLWLPGSLDTLSFCGEWIPATADASYKDPVVSDIPTLVTVGDYDPITPPSWAQTAAATLSNSYYFEYPGVGHSAFFGTQCAVDMTAAFIENPAAEPDSSCIADIALPDWYIP